MHLRKDGFASFCTIKPKIAKNRLMWPESHQKVVKKLVIEICLKSESFQNVGKMYSNIAKMYT